MARLVSRVIGRLGRLARLEGRRPPMPGTGETTIPQWKEDHAAGRSPRQGWHHRHPGEDPPAALAQWWERQERRRVEVAEAQDGEGRAA